MARCCKCIKEQLIMYTYENNHYCFNCLNNIISDPVELCKYIKCKKCGNNITMIDDKNSIAECSICKIEYTISVTY